MKESPLKEEIATLYEGASSPAPQPSSYMDPPSQHTAEEASSPAPQPSSHMGPPSQPTASRVCHGCQWYQEKLKPQPKRALAFKLLPRKKARNDAMAEEEGEFDKKKGSNHPMNNLVSEKQETTVKTKGEFDDKECKYNPITWLDRFLTGEFDEAFKPWLQAMLLDEW